MNCDLWYLATESEVKHIDRLCQSGTCRRTAVN